MKREPQAGRTPLHLLVMLGLLAACGEDNAPDDETNPVHAPEIVRIVPASEAIAGAHIPTLDPMTMTGAEILKVLGPDARCEFRYTSAGRPVLATRAASNGNAPDGVLKLNGHLVTLRRASAEAGGLMLATDSIRVTVMHERGERTGGARQREADVVFEVGDKLRVGYHGYYRCVE